MPGKPAMQYAVTDSGHTNGTISIFLRSFDIKELIRQKNIGKILPRFIFMNECSEKHAPRKSKYRGNYSMVTQNQVNRYHNKHWNVIGCTVNIFDHLEFEWLVGRQTVNDFLGSRERVMLVGLIYCSMDYLFSPKLLEMINIDRLLERNLCDKLNCQDRDNIRVRPLRVADYELYVDLLRGLTDVGDISSRDFNANFNRMCVCPDTYFIVVVEDSASAELMAAATLFVEMKFIHSCTKRGHIEDVIVGSKYRGRNLGKLLIETLVEIAKHFNCYKVSLDCKDEKVGFYEKVGFRRMNNMMYQRFDGL
ncbi:putative glucosamine 6-phosphate N-acetyltransferase [Clonorchis sinensis]|uniref:Glucosamine 6-phosphate N-acetyltransferase n=1 Tax=Clonorchis sinensis TaxID=79923 RepID=A0A8T1MVJ5_CLOSI|nr:putative glucosamine 6-phosphate N-acetyltransferase [Clonorchis sinensis]